jgi:uncharacterized protein with von Willebrand factor type A (vWA) domain
VFTRDISVAMTDYIIDFEQSYNRMRKCDMVLPDAVLAFKLLDTACLDGREKQLALTACTNLLDKYGRRSKCAICQSTIGLKTVLIKV